MLTNKNFYKLKEHKVKYSKEPFGNLFDSLLYDVERSTYYELNKVAFEVLTQLDGTKTVDEIAMQIAIKWHINKDKVKNDVIRFIDKLIKLGIVESVKGKY